MARVHLDLRIDTTHRSDDRMTRYRPILHSLGLRDSDPKRQHFRALRRVLQRLLDGKGDSSCGKMDYGSMHPTRGSISAAEWQAKLPHAYIWVDAMSIPQPALEADEPGMQQDMTELEAALESVPTYVALSWVLLILAPIVEHDDLQDVVCTAGSWRSRARRCVHWWRRWCRR